MSAIQTPNRKLSQARKYRPGAEQRWNGPKMWPYRSDISVSMAMDGLFAKCKMFQMEWGRRLARINEWKMGIAIKKVKEALKKCGKKRMEIKRFPRLKLFALANAILSGAFSFRLAHSIKHTEALANLCSISNWALSEMESTTRIEWERLEQQQHRQQQKLKLNSAAEFVMKRDNHFMMDINSIFFGFVGALLHSYQHCFDIALHVEC